MKQLNHFMIGLCLVCLIVNVCCAEYASMSEDTRAEKLLIRGRAQILSGNCDKGISLLDQAADKGISQKELQNARMLANDFKNLIQKYNDALQSRNWVNGNEAIQMLRAKGASLKWISQLKTAIDACRNSKYLREHAEKLFDKGEYETVLEYCRMAENGPDSVTWQSLRKNCEQKLLGTVSDLIQKGYTRKAWKILKQLNITSAEAIELKKRISASLIPTSEKNGLDYFSKQRWLEAGKEFALVLDLGGHNPSLETKLSECRKQLIVQYTQDTVAPLKTNRPGKALLYAIAAAKLGESDPARSPTVEECISAITDRINMNVGFMEVKNASFDPGIGLRLEDGVFRLLWQQAPKAVTLYDKRRWERKMAGETETDKGYMTIEITVFETKSWTRECVRTEEKQYQAGSVRIRNPEYDDLSRRGEVLESYLHSLRSEKRQHDSAFNQSFIDGLFGAGASIYAGGYGITEAVEGLRGMVISSVNSSDVRNEMSSLDGELASIEKKMGGEVAPFIDDPIYKEFLDNRQYFFRTARARCEVRLVDDITGRILSAREIVADSVSSDRYVPGNKLAGVAADPKDLPTEEEMIEEAVDTLIRNAANDIEESIGQVFLGYCARACLADTRNDEVSVIEEAVNFLASNAARTHQAAVVAQYVNEKVADLIPAKDSDLCDYAAEVFDIRLPEEKTPALPEVVEEPQFYGILITYENTMLGSESAAVARNIAKVLERFDRSALVKPVSQLGVIDDLKNTSVDSLAAYGRKTGRRIVVSVSAETKDTGTTTAWDATFQTGEGQVDITAVDAKTGGVIFERSVSKTAQYLDKNSTKMVLLEKLVDSIKTPLLSSIEMIYTETQDD